MVCDNLREILLSSLLREISHETFFMCKSVEQICVPSSLSLIGSWAFCSCDWLKSVIFEKPSSLKKIEDMTFDCKSLPQLSISSSATFIHYTNLTLCDWLKQIIILSLIVIPEYIIIYKHFF